MCRVLTHSEKAGKWLKVYRGKSTRSGSEHYNWRAGASRQKGVEEEVEIMVWK